LHHLLLNASSHFGTCTDPCITHRRTLCGRGAGRRGWCDGGVVCVVV
jgi:hypothetical protein